MKIYEKIIESSSFLFLRIFNYKFIV